MNDEKNRLKIGILGLGRVGTVFTSRLHQAGYNISTVWDTSPDSRNSFRLRTAGGFRVSYQHLKNCNFILICVPDREIKAALNNIVKQTLSKTYLVHTSGISGPEILAEYTDEPRLMTGALHPYMSFPTDPDDAISFSGIGFGITAEGNLNWLLQKITIDMGADPVEISSENRIAYHSAAVFASNFTVFLEMIADEIIQKTGISRTDSHRLLQGLKNSVRHNLNQTVAEDALSGPVIREDWETIKTHIDALSSNFPEFAKLYEVLSKQLADFLNLNPLP